MQFTSIHAVEICFHRNKMVCEKKMCPLFCFNHCENENVGKRQM